MSDFKNNVTEPAGKWPTFIIVGAPKAGTTSAYFYLRQHPDVFMSPVKEPHYFSIPEGKKRDSSSMHGVTFTQEEYQALFKDASSETAIGEASTGYLMSPIAARRIRQAIPTAKIIVLLRNPADRAFSGYMMKTRNSKEYTDVSEAFQRGKAYIENSFYYTNLMRYFEVFPRDQIGIFLFDDLQKDPVTAMNKIYRFIGVGGDFTPSTKKYNEAWFPKYPRLNRIRTRVLKSSRIRGALKGTAVQQVFRRLTRTDPPVFPAALRRDLLRLYAEDIAKVQDLIEMDLSFWLDEGSSDEPITLK